MYVKRPPETPRATQSHPGVLYILWESHNYLKRPRPKGVFLMSLLQRRVRSQRDGVHPTHRLVRPSRRERGGVHPTHRLVRPSRCQRGGVHPTHRLARPSRHKRGGVHPTYRLVWPSRCERAVYIPHTAPFEHFYPPLSFGGGFFPAIARTRRREIHTPPRSTWIIPPNDGGIFYRQQWGGVMDITPPRFRCI